MTDAQIIAALGGLLLPPFIAIFQRRKWGDETRFLVAGAVYLAAAAVAYWFENGADFAGMSVRGYARIFAPVMLTAVGSFQLLWKRSLAPRIEAATTPAGEPKPPTG
jgi:hypothetical protein